MEGGGRSPWFGDQLASSGERRERPRAARTERHLNRFVQNGVSGPPPALPVFLRAPRSPGLEHRPIPSRLAWKISLVGSLLFGGVPSGHLRARAHK
jgi:hypothetical protein